MIKQFYFKQYTFAWFICLLYQTVLYDPEIFCHFFQSGPGSDGNEVVPHIVNISSSGDSASGCLMSYAEHSLGEFYSFADMKRVYSAPLPDRARK